MSRVITSSLSSALALSPFVFLTLLSFFSREVRLHWPLVLGLGVGLGLCARGIARGHWPRGLSGTALDHVEALSTTFSFLSTLDSRGDASFRDEGNVGLRLERGDPNGCTRATCV
jgi:hypothetical protein